MNINEYEQKGLSIVVSYVLFVGIAVGLSIIVFSWLKVMFQKRALNV
jgi:preprotein translocase subunit Sec61beta